MQVVDNYDLIKIVTKSPNLKILNAIKSGKKRWSDFEKILNKRQVSEALKELIDLGLVKTVKHVRGLKEYNTYELTELGELVLEYLEKAELALRELRRDQEKDRDDDSETSFFEEYMRKKGWIKVDEGEID